MIKLLLKIIREVVIVSILLLLSQPVIAAIYYVRPDGGNHKICDGTSDDPAPGIDGHCAWSHPFEALPPGGEPRIKGGDTLIIGHGAYIMGRIPGLYDKVHGYSSCYSKWSYACRTSSIPSGPDKDHPTRILGEGWDTGCKNPPILQGKGKAYAILDLTNSSNVEVQCLDITDMDSCGWNYKGENQELNCASHDKEDLYGNYALHGIFSGTSKKPYNTSSNVLLKNLKIHGMASSGINAAHITDWTFEDLLINKNALAGFDGDVPPSKGENDGFFGTITFRNVEVSWTGCIEDYQTGKILKCYDQQMGGYGDGIGTGPTQNGNWVFENVSVHHNTSDGIDLLYMESATEPQVKMKKVHVEGNAGNGIKVGGSLWLENSTVIGNCDYWFDKPFSDNIIRCRGGGAALVIIDTTLSNHYIINNTFTGEAPAIVAISSRDGTPQNFHNHFYNNLLQGMPRFNDPTILSDWMYAWKINLENTLTNKYWFVYNAGQLQRYNLCNTEGTICNEDPKLKLIDPKNDKFDLHISSGKSSAIGHGLEAGTLIGYWGKNYEEVRIPTVDKDGNPRNGKTCYGAYETANGSNGLIEIDKIIELK